MGHHRRQVRGARLLALDFASRPVCRTIPGGLCLQREEHRQQAQTQSQSVAPYMRGSKVSHRRSKSTTVLLEYSLLNERDTAIRLPSRIMSFGQIRTIA